MEATKKTITEYIRTVGRRKTATATVKITPSAKTEVTVNGQEGSKYFMTPELFRTVMDPITKTEIEAKFTISAHVQGGGIAGQAQAVRHGLARALTEFNEELRGTLKKEGFLKRDPRMKERRKFGLKKARKAPQWSKR